MHGRAPAGKPFPCGVSALIQQSVDHRFHLALALQFENRDIKGSSQGIVRAQHEAIGLLGQGECSQVHRQIWIQLEVIAQRQAIKNQGVRCIDENRPDAFQQRFGGRDAQLAPLRQFYSAGAVDG